MGYYYHSNQQLPFSGKKKWYIYIIICSTARRNTVGFSWIEQKKVTRPKSHRYSNPWECKVTYDSIIDQISAVVNVSLNNRQSKIRIDMTSQVNINSKAKSIVIKCFFCLMRRVMAPLLWNWHGTLQMRHVSNDFCAHVHVECILCTLHNLVQCISVLTWKSVL